MATAQQIALLRARFNSGAQEGSISDTELGLLWDEAAETIARYAGLRWAVVPAATATRLTLDVADRLHALEVAPGGQAQYDTLDAAPVGISRDPLIAVYPILDRYLRGGFA